MSVLDALILVVLAAGLLRGFSTGIIRQVIGVAGLLFAFILGLQLMHPTGAAVSGSLGVSPSVAPLVGFVLVFLAVQVAVFALTRFVETLAGVLRLTVVNRLLGALFGVFKAAIVLSVLFLILAYFGVPGSNVRQGSAFYEPVASVLPGAWDYMSERMPEVERLSDRFGRRVEARLP